MSEYTLQWMGLCKLLWLSFFAFLYGLGGIRRKWIRRFVGPTWMMTGVYVFSSYTQSFHWWYLLYWPLLTIGLHFGYGGDVLKVKFRKRVVYGLVLGLSQLPLVFGNYLWAYFIFGVITSVVFSVFLGVCNKTKNARDEETIIAVGSSLSALFLV